MTTFYLVRHAATDWIGNALAGCLPNVPLNSTGREQADRLPGFFASRRINRVFSSPLQRAVETAAPLCQKLQLQPQLCDAIGEVQFGDWTGRKLAELDQQPDWQIYNAFRSGAIVPNGELMIETQTRIVAQLIRWQSEFPDEHVVVVSHADPIKAAIAYFLGVPLDLFQRIEISPASVSVLQLGPNSCQVLALNNRLSF